MVQLEMEQKAEKCGGVEMMQRQAENCGGVEKHAEEWWMVQIRE